MDVNIYRMLLCMIAIWGRCCDRRFVLPSGVEAMVMGESKRGSGRCVCVMQLPGGGECGLLRIRRGAE